MDNTTPPAAIPSRVPNLTGTPLSRAAGADLSQVLPDADARRVPVAAFQSSI